MHGDYGWTTHGSNISVAGGLYGEEKVATRVLVPTRYLELCLPHLWVLPRPWSKDRYLCMNVCPIFYQGFNNPQSVHFCCLQSKLYTAIYVNSNTQQVINLSSRVDLL